MKRFTIGFIGVILSVALFGGILPALVSAKSTESVLLGAVIVIAVIFALGAYVVKSFEKDKK